MKAALITTIAVAAALAGLVAHQRGQAIEARNAELTRDTNRMRHNIECRMAYQYKNTLTLNACFNANPF